MKTHSFDVVSFLSGVVFTLIGLLFLIPGTPAAVLDAIVNMGNWFWPALLLTIGAAVLIPLVIPKKGDDGNQSTPTS